MMPDPRAAARRAGSRADRLLERAGVASPARRLAAAVAILCGIAWAGNAAAHDPFEITTAGEVRPGSVVLRITLSRRSAARVVAPELKLTQPLSAATLESHRAALEAGAARLYEITTRGRALALQSCRMLLTGDDDVEFTAIYEPPEPGRFVVHAKFLERLVDGYNNAVNLSQALPRTQFGVRVLDRENSTFAVEVLPAGGAPSPPRADSAEFGKFLALGFQHLLIGYDHLLFLAALLLTARGFAGLLAIVTGFTFAHSVTLALASFKVVSLPAAVVEPMIALSIACVALENVFLSAGGQRRRVLVTVGFGLIHGFGFAEVLRELAPNGPWMTTMLRLLAFNLGIELGQVLCIAAAAPILSFLSKQPNYRPGQRLASIAIASIGLYWFIERVIASG